MNCSNCGSWVGEGARFCANCGAPAIDPEATRIARPAPEAASQRDDQSELEQVIFTTRPTLLFVKLGYAAAMLGALLLTILLAMIPRVPWYVSVLLALGLLLVPAYYHLKRSMIRYTVTDSTIEIDHGLIARTTRAIPLDKIQDVTVSRTLPQRLLGFGDVIIDNASEIGGKTILRNINNPRDCADLLLRELRKRS